MSRGPLNGRHVISLDSGDGRKLVCSWDEQCEKPGTTLYVHHECVHDVRVGCEQADRMHVEHEVATWDAQVERLRQQGLTTDYQPTIFSHGAHRVHVFCSERHRAYFVNAYGRNAHESLARTGRAYGNLPAGMRRMIR